MNAAMMTELSARVIGELLHWFHIPKWQTVIILQRSCWLMKEMSLKIIVLLSFAEVLKFMVNFIYNNCIGNYDINLIAHPGIIAQIGMSNTFVKKTFSVKLNTVTKRKHI